jgi:dTDP-4-amino-4,6-dideoxygalactose transaminase
MQAAFLNVKLKYLNDWNEQRNVIAGHYSDKLKGIGDIILPVNAPGCTSVYHLYIVRTKKRDELQTYLSKNGVQTMIHYPIPPHLQNAYADMEYKRGDFPLAEEIAETCLSLPIYPGLSETEIEYIADMIRSFYL